MLEINDIEELPEGNFPMNLKLIQKYQRSKPTIRDKYKNGTYHKCYFLGGSNIDLSKDKIVVMSKLQSCVLHWYHTYLLHPGMYRTEAMIHQRLYWTYIRDAVWKEATNCDTCQRTEQ